jgi:RND superfamily putative drug exporter
MHRFFAATGRFAVRFRWAVVVAWVAAAVLANLFFPSLTSVARQNNTSSLPASSPSLQAARLATPFQDPNETPVPVVVVRSGGRLATADVTAVGRLATSLAKVAGVRQVKDLGVSRDGQAAQLQVLANIDFGTDGPAQHLVAGLRHTIQASALPSGLYAQLAGQVAAQADASEAGQRTVNLGQDLSILFILVLLFVVFRSVLAPLLTLAPAVLVTQLAGPVIAQASKAGLQVTSLTEIMMLILTLGAGTDYGLFLVFRVREELRAGRAPHDAVSYALSRVGESITFSAATVIASLLTLLLAVFGLYSSLLRPGRVLALEHGPGQAAPRLVGTHRRPHRHPPGSDTHPRPASVRRIGHRGDRLHPGRPGGHPGRPPRLGLRHRQRAARRPLPGRQQQPHHRAAALPRTGLARRGTGCSR